MNAMFDSWEMLRNHQDDQAFAKSMTLFGNGSTMLSRRTVDELIEAAAQILAPRSRRLSFAMWLPTERPIPWIASVISEPVP
ncbi:hypothetical protein P4209_13235 [Pseudomonas aeruginosa]|nr:hypothetical protein [Pseudomonas aeruginosa]MDF5927332.1 hypothetical protein [Pseudomonas aeruginosa]